MNELQGIAPGGPVPLASPELVPDAVGDVPASQLPVHPPTAAPPASGVALTAPPPAPAGGATTAGVDLTKPAAPAGEAAPDGGKRSRTWVWLTVGGAVVLAGAVTTALLLGGKTNDPTPSLGTVGGKSTP